MVQMQRSFFFCVEERWDPSCKREGNVDFRKSVKLAAGAMLLRV